LAVCAGSVAAGPDSLAGHLNQASGIEDWLVGVPVEGVGDRQGGLPGCCAVPVELLNGTIGRNTAVIGAGSCETPAAAAAATACRRRLPRPLVAASVNMQLFVLYMVQ